MSDKKKHRKPEEVIKYLGGRLSGWERNELEREMESDPFLRDAMEGLENLSPEEIEQDMHSLQKSLSKRIKRRRRITLYSAAAAIASLLIVTTLFVKLHDFEPEEASEAMSEKALKTEAPSALEDESVAVESDDADITGELPEETTPVMEKPESVSGISSEETRAAGKKDAKEKIQEQPDATPEEKEAVERTGKGDTEILILADEEEEFAEITVYEAEAYEEVEEYVVAEITEKKEAEQPRTTRRSQSLSKMASRGQAPALAAADQTLPYQMKIDGMVISSEDSMPIPGAVVIVKGTGLGVVTDVDGNFNIAYAGDSSPTLVASFIGMESKDYQIEDNRNIQLALDPDVVALNEVVIVSRGVSNVSYSESGAVSSVEISDKPGAVSYRSAEPEGGNRAFKKYIENNIRIPDTQDESERVVVILRLTITASGELKDTQILRSPGEAYSEEALRLINNGPDWTPAERDGEIIEETVCVRIVF